MIMMPVAMDVLMTMHSGFMAVFVPIMRMGHGLMPVFMFMLVFAVAAHGTPSFLLI